VLADRVMMLKGSTRGAMSVALVAVLAVAMYGWLVSPHVGYLRAVQAYEPVVKEAATQKEILDKALEAKQRRLDAMRAELTELRAVLFTAEEARDFFGGMEALCRKAGCAVTSVDFDVRSGRHRAQASPEPVVAQACQSALTILGRYDQIVSLLNDLQTRPQRVCIDVRRMELADAHSTGLKCEATVTVWVICAGENPDDE
jgi:Tfp pilus assembly protein PilO